jgi:hypothetical protein
MQRFKRRPSAATVLAFVALVVALSGSAIATPVAHIAKQITGKNIKNSTITGADVKNGRLSGADIKNGSIGSADIGTFQVKGAEIAPDSIGGDKVKPDSLDGSDIIESGLGKVPAAGNADAVQGHGASDFVSTSHLQSWNLKLNQGDDKVLAKNEFLELHAVCDPAGTVPAPQGSTHYYILNSGTVGHGVASASDGTAGGANPDADFNPGDSALFNYNDIGDIGGVQLPNGASMVTNGTFATDNVADPATFGGDCAFSGSVNVTGAG